MTDALSNMRWQAQVHRFLRTGYGVEDIAVLMACDVEHVRDEVSILRLEGELKGILDETKKIT